MNAWCLPAAKAMFATAAVAALAVLSGCGDDDSPSRPDTSAPLDWSRTAVVVIAEDGTLSPMEESRAMAMAFTAAHDALNAIDPRYVTYTALPRSPDANPDAAVATAVYDVLNAILPTSQLLDDEYETAMFNISNVPAGRREAGIALGRQAAANLLNLRQGDGSATAQGPYMPDTAPGTYQVTPPINFAAFVNWGKVKPFSVPDITTFRVPPPYTVLDTAYAADFNEVKMLGGMTSAVRTRDQSEIAKFWLESTPQSVMRIATIVAAERKLNGWDQARLFALLQMAEADAYTASLESKYHYKFWRPITAIHGAANDNNVDTVADPDWIPFDPVTPPIPDYPSGHAVGAGAGEVVLRAVFGGDAATFRHTSTSPPFLTRNFTTFSQMASEIALSRIYVGYHFRLAVDEGRKQGQQVGAHVVATMLRPL